MKALLRTDINIPYSSIVAIATPSSGRARMVSAGSWLTVESIARVIGYARVSDPFGSFYVDLRVLEMEEKS